MIANLSVLVDECIAPRCVEAMNGVLKLSKFPPKIMPLIEFTNQYGVKDKDWIPQAAKQGFTVISTDLGNRKRGDKLPEICRQFGVKHVLISQKIHHRGSLAMALASLGTWENIGEACTNCDSSGFKLRLVVVSGRDEIGPHRHALHRHPKRTAKTRPRG